MYCFKKFTLLLLSICSIEVHAIEYGLDAKFDVAPRISRLQIFSERCSGSNYIESLINKNIEFYPPLRSYPTIGPHDGPFGHKHFPLSFEIPPEKYHGPAKFLTFEGNEDALFLVIFRNPYDWVRSFHLQPHHAIRELYGRPFSEFIHEKWQLNPNAKCIQKAIAHNPFPDRDPITGNLFSNVMKLRSSKIRTMLEIKNRVNNIYYINYETALLYPEEVLNEIATLFNLKRKSEFIPVDKYKGLEDKKAYKPKKYGSISQNDLNFINSQLDPALEHLIGYEIINDSSRIP